MTEDAPALPAPASTALVPVPPLSAVEILPALEDSDARLVALWLHGRSPATARAYQADLAAFRAVIPRPLRQVTLGDLQAYQDTLEKMAPTTQARRLSAIKESASQPPGRRSRSRPAKEIAFRAAKELKEAI